MKGISPMVFTVFSMLSDSATDANDHRVIRTFTDGFNKFHLAIPALGYR